MCLALEKAVVWLFLGALPMHTAPLLRGAHTRSPPPRRFVASTIIGATGMEQLRENIEAFDVELSEECLADIDAVYRRYRDPAFN